MNILAIDTSAKVSSVAIINDDRILSEFNIDTRLTHSQSLMPMIESVTKIAQININDIDGFSVSTGPGSFTGLRIGIGAIKGLAYALNKPCVGVSALLALATNLSNVDGIICPVMDARCSQVYTAVFDCSNNKLTRLCDDMAISIDDLLTMLKQYKKNIFFVGDGYSLCYNRSIDVLDNVKETSENIKFQRASSVAFASINDFKNGNTVTATELMPLYLRLPQAERERNERLKKEKIKEDV